MSLRCFYSSFCYCSIAEMEVVLPDLRAFFSSTCERVDLLSFSSVQVRYCRGFQPVVRGPPGFRVELPRDLRSTPEKLETRCILTKQKYRPNQCCRYRLRRTELKTSLVFAMCNDLDVVHVSEHLVEFKSFGYAILIRHVLTQPGVRKVEALGRGGPPPELGIFVGPQRDKS